jgi:hypothetical protein
MKIFTFLPITIHPLFTFVYIPLQSVDRNTFNFYNNPDRQKLIQINPFIDSVFIAPGPFKNAIGVCGAYAASDSVLLVYTKY